MKYRLNLAFFIAGRGIWVEMINFENCLGKRFDIAMFGNEHCARIGLIDFFNNVIEPDLLGLMSRARAK